MHGILEARNAATSYLSYCVLFGGLRSVEESLLGSSECLRMTFCTFPTPTLPVAHACSLYNCVRIGVWIVHGMLGQANLLDSFVTIHDFSYNIESHQDCSDMRCMSVALSNSVKRAVATMYTLVNRSSRQIVGSTYRCQTGSQTHCLQ